MGRLLAKIVFEMSSNRNMKNAVEAKAAAQLIDQVVLGINNLAGGAMAYERHLLAMCYQFLDCPRERIQTTREQNDLVGRKSRIFRA